MICCGVLLAGCGIDNAVAATDAQQSDATFDPNDDPFGWTKFGDSLAAVTPPKESYTENLPPMSMSPTWERPTDCSGSAAIPKSD